MISLWFVAALANFVIVNASSQQIEGHLLFARQSPPRVGQRCGNSATDRVCAVTVVGSTWNATCGYACCTDARGNFVITCGFGDRCVYDSSHNFRTCCRADLPASQCVRATACVNAGQTAAQPTVVCSPATPICSVDPVLGAICSGTYSDYLTLVQSATASASTGPTAENTTPSSAAVSTPAPEPQSSYTPPTTQASQPTAESTSTTVETTSTTEEATSSTAETTEGATSPTAETTSTTPEVTNTPVVYPTANINTTPTPTPASNVSTPQASTPAAFTGGEAAVRPIWGLLVSLTIAVGLAMTLLV